MFQLYTDEVRRVRLVAGRHASRLQLDAVGVEPRGSLDQRLRRVVWEVVAGQLLRHRNPGPSVFRGSTKDLKMCLKWA